MPTTAPSTSTWNVWPLGTLARWAAENVSVYVPAANDIPWLMPPVPWRNATSVPCGALALPVVNRLPLPATPAEP